MSYRLSKARKAFDQAADSITANIKTVNTAAISQKHNDYIFAAAIFLAHAEIENYFSDVLNNIASLYSKHSANSRNLPPSLRAHLLLKKSNIIKLAGEKIAGGSEKELINKISMHLQQPHAFAADTALSITAFTGVDIYESSKYPSLKNLDKVLTRIGITDVKNNLNRVAKRDVISLLESLAALRTALAHSASLPGVSKQDIITRITDGKKFVGALDRLLHENLKKTHPSNCWEQEMT